MYANYRTFTTGFKEIRAQAIEALKEGRIQHEARGEVDEKNLLLVGEITIEQVIRMLNACEGTQHTSSPHHIAPEVEVHVFKPEASLDSGGEKENWYIKLSSICW